MKKIYPFLLFLIVSQFTLAQSQYFVGSSVNGIFRVKEDGSEYTVIHEFPFTSNVQPGKLTLNNGFLYGVTKKAPLKNDIFYKVKS